MAHPSDHTRPSHAWVYGKTLQPDVCCVCGMFTDNRAALKHAAMVTRHGKAKMGSGLMLLHVFLHFLGPFGWIISAGMRKKEPDNSDSKIVKQKIKVRISICRLCHGSGTPDVIDTQLHPSGLMLKVHPRYISALAAEQEKQVE